MEDVVLEHSLGWEERAATVLGAVSRCRIFNAEVIDGRLWLSEKCDNYFSVELTKEQALRLCDELRALAEQLPG